MLADMHTYGKFTIEFVTNTMVTQGKCKLRQTKAEMARPGEGGYGQKPDDDRDGIRQNTLACHDDVV